MYEGQSGAPWWIRVDAVTTDRYLVAIQSGYINTALPTAVIGPRLAGYGGALRARACTARSRKQTAGCAGGSESSFIDYLWSTKQGVWSCGTHDAAGLIGVIGCFESHERCWLRITWFEHIMASDCSHASGQLLPPSELLIAAGTVTLILRELHADMPDHDAVHINALMHVTCA